MRAGRHYQRNEFAAAIPLLRRLLNMGRTHGYDLLASSDPAIVNDDARLNLGVCLLRTGELDEAESHFRLIPANSPRASAAQANLAAIESLRRQFT